MKNLDKDIFEEQSKFGINKQSKELLTKVVFWTKFVSIAGFITVFLIFFGSIIIVINRDSSMGQAFPNWLMSILAFIPLIYLFKFSKKLNQSLLNSDEIILQKSIQLLKSYFKTIGITMIVVFVVYFLAILGTFIYKFYNS